MSELNKQELKIGFADYQDGVIGEILCECIRSEISDKYNITDRWSYYGDELLEFVKTSAVDIFILNMNCITDSGETLGLRGRLEHSYKILTQIKETYGRPVIALSGWREDSSLIARAKLAADFYFPMPFKTDAFMDAFEKCLAF